jgi:hypothetical protein
MRRTPAALLVMFTLVACAAAPPAPLPLTELGVGHYGPCREARREVVRDPTRWAQAWAEVQATRMAPPPVAFEGQMAIVACLGERRSGGHAIEIVSVAVADDALIVTVRTSSPAPGAITTQALTAPYHIVRVARSALPVRWVELK